MAWIEVTCQISRDLADMCGETLENLGALSVSFLEAQDTPVLEPMPGQTPLWNTFNIVGLFEAKTDVETLQSSLLTLFPSLRFTATALADKDWSREWLSHFKPLCFGSTLWISPSDHPFSSEPHPDKTLILLDPGLAFGTGTHPTTALCLKWLDANPPIDKTIIDYGCGSGILAVAALKLGAKTAWGVDYDPQALTATTENALRNQLNPNQIHAVLPEALPNNINAPVILANILAQPLIELAPLLRMHCEMSGKLVLSGLLSNQIDTVLEAYTEWFSFETPQIEENWALLVGSRTK